MASTIDADGTPRYDGKPIKDQRAHVMELFRKHPKRTLALGDFGFPFEQVAWALDMLVRSNDIAKVGTNGYRIVEKRAADPVKGSEIAQGAVVRRGSTALVVKTMGELAGSGEWLDPNDIANVLDLPPRVVMNALYYAFQKGEVVRGAGGKYALTPPPPPANGVVTGGADVRKAAQARLAELDAILDQYNTLVAERDALRALVKVWEK